MAQIFDKTVPRDNNSLLTPLSHGIYWYLHPGVTLFVALLVLDININSVGVFVGLLVVLKGIPILVLGINTNADASMHTASVVFLFGGLTVANGTLFGTLIATLFTFLVMFSVWWLNTHDLLGIFVGMLIGFVSVGAM